MRTVYAFLLWLSRRELVIANSRSATISQLEALFAIQLERAKECVIQIERVKEYAE